MLILGCQNTTIQWFSIDKRHEVSRADREQELIARRSKVFDSAASCVMVDESLLQSIKDKTDAETQADLELSHSLRSDEFVIFDNTTIPYAHNGFVYALLIGNFPDMSDTEVLISAAGDGAIKVSNLLCSSPSTGVNFYTYNPLLLYFI